jgi:hypothetical protein
MRRIKELFLLHSPHSFIFICLSLERRREQRRVQICESKGECRFVRAWRREQRRAWRREQRGAWRREQRQPSISSFNIQVSRAKEVSPNPNYLISLA